MARAGWIAVTLMALAAGGCMFGPFKSQQAETNPLARPIDVKELQPGMYCELDMRMPPTADPDAYRCYLGTVSEVTAEGVLLTDAIEESWEERPKNNPVEAMRGTIRIPLTGVVCVGLTTPPKKFAAAHGSASPPPVPTS